MGKALSGGRSKNTVRTVSGILSIFCGVKYIIASAFILVFRQGMCDDNPRKRGSKKPAGEGAVYRYSTYPLHRAQRDTFQKGVSKLEANEWLSDKGGKLFLTSRYPLIRIADEVRGLSPKGS